MTPKSLFEHFKVQFPWFVPNVDKFKGNKSEGGIDIYMTDGTVLNYQYSRTGWLLQKGVHHDNEV